MASKSAIIAAVRLSTLNVPKSGLVQNPRRAMSTLKPHIKKKMEIYGIDDGSPVFRKGGTLDNILYRLTMGLCVGSIGLISVTMYELAVGKGK